MLKVLRLPDVHFERRTSNCSKSPFPQTRALPHPSKKKPFPPKKSNKQKITRTHPCLFIIKTFHYLLEQTGERTFYQNQRPAFLTLVQIPNQVRD